MNLKNGTEFNRGKYMNITQLTAALVAKLIILTLCSTAIELTWNETMPALGLPILTFWQTIGISIIILAIAMIEKEAT